MKGKIKRVARSEWRKGCQGGYHDGDHMQRYTNTYAVLFDGKDVSIDENDIRRFYGCQRITETCIAKLNDALRNKEIEFSADNYGDFWLVGSLANYIK